MGVYALIVLATLVFLDLVLMATGLFPPRANFGDPAVGWVSGRGTGKREVVRCIYPATGSTMEVERNEVGYRTSHMVSELEGKSNGLEIAVAGDSHSDLCLPNEQMHFGVLESELRRRGLEAAVYAYAAGRYSPLQAYLALQDSMQSFAPDVFVLNLYTGNDFYDMLRIDDRPHLVSEGDGYRVASPVWYEYDEPGSAPRSRVLYVLRSLSDRVGLGNVVVRLRYLTDMADDHGGNLASVVGYLNDLRKSTTPEVGYPAAFAAQILNQQLFFLHFPGSADESVRRVRALMDMIRERYPEMLLVMSPIPSYQLVGDDPVDGAFLRLLEDLPMTYEDGMRMEADLYQRLEAESRAADWLFVDLLTPLRSYDGPERLYDDFDYHITPTANRLIGETQAAALMTEVSSGRFTLPAGAAGVPH